MGTAGVKRITSERDRTKTQDTWPPATSTTEKKKQQNPTHHVVFDFLEHVVIGHDEFLGCVAVGDVRQDAQRLIDECFSYGVT